MSKNTKKCLFSAAIILPALKIVSGDMPAVWGFLVSIGASASATVLQNISLKTEDEILSQFQKIFMAI